MEKKDNPNYYEIIKNFKHLTGVGAVLNTSLNLHGFPVVRNEKDALYVFENSGLDILILENFILKKNKKFLIYYNKLIKHLYYK